jgi:signal transduction histidine kinase
VLATVVRDPQQLVAKIARVIAELIGDGCIVTLIGDDGETLLNAANAHRDPALERDYRAYLAGLGVSKTTSASVAAEVIRTGEPKLMGDILPATLIARVEDTLKPIAARLNVHSVAIVPIRAHSSVIGSLSIQRSQPGRGYTEEDATLLQDIADRAGLAIENARLYDDLERRVRLRTAELEAVNTELDAFAHSVAHDLRSPLRVINAFSQAVVEDYGEHVGPEGRGQLQRIARSAARMGQLIDGLLSLARMAKEEIQHEPVDLGNLVRGVIPTFQDQDRNVEWKIDDDMIVRGDPRLLRSLVQNLVGNAWKFTSKVANARITVGWTSGSDTYFVRDNGAGFDMALARDLFTPFKRLHSDAEFVGTGIGLATVQRIVRRHGGRIWAEGHVGEGATFFFTIPTAPRGTGRETKEPTT